MKYVTQAFPALPGAILVAMLVAIVSACSSTRFDDGRNESLALKSIRQANTALYFPLWPFYFFVGRTFRLDLTSGASHEMMELTPSLDSYLGVGSRSAIRSRRERRLCS